MKKIGKGAVATLGTAAVAGYTILGALVLQAINPNASHGPAHVLLKDSGEKIEKLWKWVGDD